MRTRNICVLRNFSHVSGSYVKGDHICMDLELANQFIEANLVSICEHEHEGDPGILEVPETPIPTVETAVKKTRKTRKKVDK